MFFPLDAPHFARKHQRRETGSSVTALKDSIIFAILCRVRCCSMLLRRFSQAAGSQDMTLLLNAMSQYVGQDSDRLLQIVDIWDLLWMANVGQKWQYRTSNKFSNSALQAILYCFKCYR